MKKRSQKLRIIDRLVRYGCITNRIAMTNMAINNPFARIKELRRYVDIRDFIVIGKSGAHFKIYYTDKRKAQNYAKRNGLKLAA